MWTKSNQIQPIVGLFLSILIHIAHTTGDYECSRELWDEVKEGRGVKRLEFSCTAGQVIWHAPYGGLFIDIKGPAKEHQLCIQAQAIHTSALISIIEEPYNLRRLITIEQKKSSKKPQQQKHTLCFPARGNSVLFVEPDMGAFVSSKFIMDFDVEMNPKYGEDACSPCTDEELLYHYCTSDFVAIGQMKAVIPSPSANIIPVSLDLVKQQSSMYFTKTLPIDKTYSGKLYTPPQCKMEHGRGKFIFMGKIKFNKAELRCAPTYEDFTELQRTSKLKGSSLCS